MDIIHDKLQPLGLSRSKSLISFKTVIDRPLPIEENPNAPQEEDKEKSSREDRGAQRPFPSHSSNKGQPDHFLLAFVLLLHRRGLFVNRGPTH